MTEYVIQETFVPLSQPTDSIKIGEIELDHCLDNENFYISRTAPFIFANANGTIVDQSDHYVPYKHGDYRCKRVQFHNNRKTYHAYVHILIASQYIINDNPLKKTEVDHRDRNACNNNIDNLRWASPRLNNFNRITDERQYFVNHLSDRAISVSSYNGHQLDDDEVHFFFDPADNMFYVQVDVNSYRSFVLSSRIRYKTNDIDGVQVNIPLKKLQAMCD